MITQQPKNVKGNVGVEFIQKNATLKAVNGFLKRIKRILTDFRIGKSAGKARREGQER